MKRTFILVLSLLFISTSALAFLDEDNSTNQNNSQKAYGGDAEQGQQQGQIGINKNKNDLNNQQGQGQQQGQVGINKNKNDNDNSNDNTNKQGQGQGQDQGQEQGQSQKATSLQGQGQAQGANNKQGQSTNVSIEGDDFKSYSFAPPGLSANKGVAETQMNSIFGGVGFAQTEEYTVVIEKIAVIERLEKLNYMDHDVAVEEAMLAFAQLKEATKPKRTAGFLWKTRGRHAGNLLGLLSMDDLRFAIKKGTRSEDSDTSYSQNF